MAYRFFKPAFTLVAIATLTACAPSSGAYFERPNAAKSATVTLAAGTTTASVAVQLRKLGFVAKQRSQTQVAAAGRGTAFVNCGTITQYRDGNASKFSGATPLSVIYTDSESQKFLTRQVAVTTRVLVTMAGNRATVSEGHDVTILWSASDGSGSSRESKSVVPGETVTFSDGTICGTGTSIAAQLR